MLFSDSIPDKLQEYPHITSFLGVLDGVQQYKTEIIAESLRVNNPAILMDKKWLLKKISEYGISDFPFEYPIQIMQQYLLNADTLYRLRGSKLGIEFYCSLLSLGEVTLDDSGFYKSATALILDSFSQGFITSSNSDDFYYLFDDTDLLNPKVKLSITITSKYFSGEYPVEEKSIKEYLQKTISNQLGFSPDKDVTFTFLPGTDFYFHKLLNPYFV